MRTNGKAPLLGIRGANAKMIRDSERKTIEFYDLQQDPRERSPIDRNRVAAGQAAEFRELESTLDRWLGFCLSRNPGADTIDHLDPELIARLKSLGYLQ